MLETIKKSFLSGIVISRTIIISLLGFTVYAGSFDGLTSMSQTWYNLVNLKLNGVYTSGKMCTSDASGQIHCITDIPSGNVPTGAVMAFNGTTCPTGWTIADGSGDEKNTAGVNTSLDLRGDFIRGLDSGRGADSGRTLGSWQDYDWKGFYQTNTVQGGMGYSHGPIYMGKSTTGYVGNLFVGYWSAPAARLGTMWDNSEIRPRNVALLYCVKL